MANRDCRYCDCKQPCAKLIATAAICKARNTDTAWVAVGGNGRVPLHLHWRRVEDVDIYGRPPSTNAAK